MTCRELTEFILAYLENELAPEQRRDFDAHLSECPTCVDFLNSYRRTILVTNRTARELESSVAATIPEKLVQLILAVCSRPTDSPSS